MWLQDTKYLKLIDTIDQNYVLNNQITFQLLIRNAELEKKTPRKLTKHLGKFFFGMHKL